MKKLTPNGIEKYLTENYGTCRHNTEKMAKACREAAKAHEVTPLEVFHFVVEGASIPKLHTHSYGFHTANGRALMDEFRGHYYS